MEKLKKMIPDLALNCLSVEEQQRLLLNDFFPDGVEFVAVNNSYNGKPMPARPKNLSEVILGHLTGNVSEILNLKTQKTEKRNFRVGTYSIRPGTSTCKWVCFDLDGSGHKHPLADPEGVVIHLAAKCKAMGLHFYIERSFNGMGFHLWIFFDELVEAKIARELGRIISQGEFSLATGGFANVGAGQGIEIFPKQDRVAIGGYGNLVWLPWYHLAKEGNNCFYKLGGE